MAVVGPSPVSYTHLDVYKRQLVDLKCNVLIPLIYVDNQSALNMCESYENSRRTRPVSYTHLLSAHSIN